MTFLGTNSYILGTGEVAVIDPGPNLQEHQRALLEALTPGETISHIFVTHAHLDHSPLARPLARETGAKILAFGPATAGRSSTMQQLAAEGLVAGGEGVDTEFCPDIHLRDGQLISHSDWWLEAIHTPGHMANHLCFASDKTLFSGDHVMGWASSLISPPDGDMGAYLHALQHLAGRDWEIFHPGHGADILTPNTRLTEIYNHRLAREAAILAYLSAGPAAINAITLSLYHDTPCALLGAAERNVFAHLIELTAQGKTKATPTIGISSKYSLA